MIKYIEGKEKTTRREAKHKYAEYYIGFVVLERVEVSSDLDVGYVACVMDSQDDWFTIPRGAKEIAEGETMSLVSGHSATKGYEIGGVCID